MGRVTSRINECCWHRISIRGDQLSPLTKYRILRYHGKNPFGIARLCIRTRTTGTQSKRNPERKIYCEHIWIFDSRYWNSRTRRVSRVVLKLAFMVIPCLRGRWRRSISTYLSIITKAVRFIGASQEVQPQQQRKNVNHIKYFKGTG